MAERALTAEMLAEIASGILRPALFFEGEYDSGGSAVYARLWTGAGDLDWGGSTWYGGGKLLSISPIEEPSTLQAVGFSVSMSGIASADVSRALQSMRKKRSGELWLGLFDASSALIANPYLLRRGRFNFSVISDDGETATIEARYEDRLILLEIPRMRRYTTEDQALRLAGDLGFDQVPELQDTQDVWGI